MSKDMQVHLHIYAGPEEDAKLLTKLYVFNPPRLGDEIRIKDRVYKVMMLIWCYDEEVDYERMNLRVEALGD